MRQVDHNGKLTAVSINKAAVDQYDQTCTQFVTSCGAMHKPEGDHGCHMYYKCDSEGNAYSCQNPKILSKKCSEEYFSIGKGKEHYRCPPDSLATPAQQIVCSNHHSVWRRSTAR